MFWIFGGGYKLGSSANSGYDGSRISRDGDVVVVTFNYRVGIEGFAAIEGAPANRGLLDQVAALEWVRDNIAAFGGDPAQITVFAESAGAGSVAALLAMPRARGLFRRAILQSMPGTYFSNALAGDIATTIAAKLGLRPTAAALSAIAPDALSNAATDVAAEQDKYKARWGAIASGVYPLTFAPVVDGDVLPCAPWQAVAAGAARDIELIVGHTRDEFRLFMAFGKQLGNVTDEQAASALRIFGPTPDAARQYREGMPGASSERLYEIVQSDWLFRMPSLHLAEDAVAAGGRVHFYDLTWQTPGNGGALGAPHGLDGSLVFATFGARLGPLLLGPQPSAAALELSAQFRAAWIAFAKTGEPGWPRYEANERLVQVFDSPSKVAAYPEEVSWRIWRDHAFDALPLLGAKP
jgi:para-nitrobenzyl esterase